jgi:hypothetical protein
MEGIPRTPDTPPSVLKALVAHGRGFSFCYRSQPQELDEISRGLFSFYMDFSFRYLHDPQRPNSL